MPVMVDGVGGGVAGLGIAGLEDEVLIGRGGFAVVYRAYQPAFRRTVAVKVVSVARVDALTRERFERECQAMGLLSEHPGIVTVLDAGFLDDGRPYLVMAYMTHGSMEDRLEDRGPLGWEDATRVGVKLAGALDTAHQTGVIHRDVKPANVLISQYGEPQLSDFGIARVAGGPETTSGVITASLAFAPPEVIEGQHPTVRSDVYSLAATLYALLDGRSAFQRPGESIGALINRVLNEPPDDLRLKGVPEPVWDVIARGLEKDPEARFGSAADLGRGLRDAEVTLGVQPTDLTLHAPPVVVDSDGVGEADVPTQVVDGDGDVAVAVTTQAPIAPALEVTDTFRGDEEPLPFYRRRPVIVGSIAALVVAVVIGVVALNSGDDEPTATPPSATQTAQTTEAATLPIGVVPVLDAPIEIDMVLIDLIGSAPTLTAARALACPDGLTKDYSGRDFSGRVLENVDFRCADLRDADFSSTTFRNVTMLGADLSGANLANTRFFDSWDFSGVIAVGTNFTEAVFQGSGFHNGDFTRSDFSNALFIESSFIGAVFDQATFRGAFILGANFGVRSLLGTDMTETKMYFSFGSGPPEVGTADWTGATCPDGSAAELHESGCVGVDAVVGTSIPLSDWCPKGVKPSETPPVAGQPFDERVVRCVDLSGLDLRGTDWSNSILIGVDFTDSDLTAATMSGALLIGVTFSNTVMLAMHATTSSWWDVDADGVDFADLSVQGSEDQDPFQLRWMNLDGRDLSSLRGFVLIHGTSVRDANLTGLVLVGNGLVDLEGADLTGATLRGGWDMTSMVGTIMRDVQMSDSNMLEVDLSGADLTGAVATNVAFNGANLSGAIVTGADFTGAIWDNTTCPDGTLNNPNNFGSCDV